MSRYREAGDIPAGDVEGIRSQFGTKGSGKVINYIWMPDKNGNLVKKDSAIIKKTFSTLSQLLTETKVIRSKSLDGLYACGQSSHT